MRNTAMSLRDRINRGTVQGKRALRAWLLPSLLALSVGLPASAQREWGGTPPSLGAPEGVPGGSGTQAMLSQAPTVLLPSVDNAALLAEDELEFRPGILRFAHAHSVELSPVEDGLWTTLADGSRVWRLRLHSPGAESLSLLFSRFQLPRGAELYAYNDGAETVRGAYTLRNHKGNGQFAIQPTPGDGLTLEYWQPAGTRTLPELNISTVYHAYRPLTDVAPSAAGGSSNLVSGACQVDVVCPEGVPFASEAETVVHIIIGLNKCSGSLINNTAQDGRLLVLTAEHCGDLANAIFTFDFKESTCAGTGVVRTNTVQGAATLVVDDPLDFQLVELEEQPSEAYAVRYLGWDRSDVPPVTGTLGLHHPGGDPMKICLDDHAPTKAGTFWNIGAWEIGTTEPGSSGSPLLDRSGRFIGQLSFGTADCATPTNDNYGRLAAQWALVAPFLDPLGSGALTLDLFDPNAGATDPLSLTGTTPTNIPALIPGTGQDVALLGTGFQDGMTLSLNGNPVTGFTRRSAGRLILDMPQLPSLGLADFVLTKGIESSTFGANIIANDPLAFQAGTGDSGNPVGSATGVDLTFSGEPGDLHLVIYSFSDLPSSHPLWMIEIGNSFADLISLGCHVIGPSGTTDLHVPISGIALTSLFGQTTNISGGIPFEVSNLQEIFVIF